MNIPHRSLPARPNRRQFLHQAGIAAAASLALPRLSAQQKATLPFENGTRDLVTYPGKRALIRHTARPPQLETPFSVFNEGVLTPNDAFFVRYHLADIPLRVDPASFRLTVKGAVNTPLNLSLAQLKALGDPVEYVAVNQCSGNSRGFFNPRIAGGQLGHGAMGNARWTGVPLKRILEKAGLAASAKQVVFDGLDRAVVAATPDFVKALDVDHTLDGEVMLAYAMNGEDLPMLNGYPLRLVVPGYYGTYWVKHVHEITVADSIFNGFWMAPAYRLPDTPNQSITPGETPKKTVPITRFTIRSFITSVGDGARLPASRATVVRGIAFDSGHGITEVQFSSDGGRTWRGTELGRDHGRYSFREWTVAFTPGRAGRYELMARAFNRNGETQPLEPLWNPAGYRRNVVEKVTVNAA